MTPEELKEIRSTLEFASQAGAKDEFMDTTFNLLEFIDEQAAQIEALKEKLVKERTWWIFTVSPDGLAHDFLAKFRKRTQTAPFDPRWLADARQQLKADPDLQKSGVTWDE